MPASGSVDVVLKRKSVSGGAGGTGELFAPKVANRSDPESSEPNREAAASTPAMVGYTA
jgi:hypothetical protein